MASQVSKSATSSKISSPILLLYALFRCFNLMKGIQAQAFTSREAMVIVALTIEVGAIHVHNTLLSAC